MYHTRPYIEAQAPNALHGAHFWVGAPLARLEGRIAIDTLLRRMPMISLASERLEWRDNVTLRGVKALPVTF